LSPDVRDRSIAILLAVGAAWLLWSLRPYGLSLADEGNWIHPVLRMRAGELLYRDIWYHYAPLQYHVLAGLFALTGPSVLAERGLSAAVIVATVAASFLFARRLAPVSLAWIPAVVVALTPGPWHKAPFALCEVLFLLALARALEQPTRARHAVVGASVGFALVTRQDVGLVALAIGLAVLAVSNPRGARARALASFAVPAIAVVAPFVAFYAAHGALAAVGDWLFVRAAAQRGAQPFALWWILRNGLAKHPEGTLAACMLLAPVAIAIAALLGWALRLRRYGLDRESLLVGSTLALALATLDQIYRPMLILRLLQAALPTWLLATWLAARALGAGTALRRALVVTAASATAAAWVMAIVWGVPRIESGDQYTGSWRMRRLNAPIEIFDEQVRTPFVEADAVRRLRLFLDSHAAPGEPIFAAPQVALLYEVLGHPNPTPLVFEHPGGAFLLSGPQREEVVRRLLASPTRWVLAEGWWLGWPGTPDTLRRAVMDHFHPVRQYGSIVVLERDDDPRQRDLAELYWRMLRARPRPSPRDLELLNELMAAHPSEPLLPMLLGALLERVGRNDAAVEAYRTAGRLAPEDGEPWELAAAVLRREGRDEEAIADLERALAVRPNPDARRDLDLARAAVARRGAAAAPR